jgi:hypothetical protein
VSANGVETEFLPEDRTDNEIGGLFVGVMYWYLHLQGEPDVTIDGLYYDRIEGHDPKVDARGLHFRQKEDLESGKSRLESDATAAGMGPEATGGVHGG